MKDWLKRNYLYIIGIILGLLLAHNCANDREKELNGENKQLKEQLKKQREELLTQEENRRALKDSFSREIKKIKEKEQILTENNRNLQNKVVDLQKKLNKSKEIISNYTYEQSSLAFNARYGKGSSVFTDTSVNLLKTTPQKTLSELAEKDVLQEEVKIKDEIIVNKDSIIDGKNKVIDLREKEIVEAEKTISMQKETLETSEKLNDNANKQIKKLKVKNTVKSLLIPIMIIGTVLIVK